MVPHLIILQITKVDQGKPERSINKASLAMYIKALFKFISKRVNIHRHYNPMQKNALKYTKQKIYLGILNCAVQISCCCLLLLFFFCDLMKIAYKVLYVDVTNTAKI